MPPLSNFTTKAKEAIRRSHELAIERGQNQVTPLHLLTALLLQEESMVISILDKLEVDTVLLSDSVLEAIETPELASVMSPAYQIYLTPELVQVFNGPEKFARFLKDEFVSTEHLFIALLEVPVQTREIIARFRITKEQVISVLDDLRSQKITET